MASKFCHFYNALKNVEIKKFHQADEIPSDQWDLMAVRLSREFRVSAQVISVRLDREKLIDEWSA